MAKKQTTNAPPVQVLDAPTEDQQLVASNIDKIGAFIANAAAFFSKARSMEKAAKERLDQVNQLERELTAATAPGKLVMPRSQDEDEKVQTMIRASKVARKANDEHWSITTLLSQAHKATVAGRERIGALDDQAAATAQKLHNRYTEEQKRLADIENERLRREAEQRAAEDRAREAAELERKAVDAENASPNLSEREQSFVQLVTVNGLGPTAAAQRAGFAKPEQAGERLMNSKKIQAALDAYKQAAVIREQAAARRDRPIEVEVETVKPAISRSAGSFDRSSYSAEVYDVDAFMAALLDPRTRTQLGIPADVATFLQPKMNELARALKENINRWPGVRLKKSTTTV